MDKREIGAFDRGIVKAKNTIDGIYNFVSGLANVHREMNIEEAAVFYTKNVDDFIRSSEKSSGNSYVAGQLIFQYVNAEIFLLMLDLYFQDAGGKWVKQRSQTTQALKYLRPEAAAELREKKEISFEIDPPAATEEAPAPAEESAPATAPPTIAAPAETPAAEESPAPAERDTDR